MKCSQSGGDHEESGAGFYELWAWLELDDDGRWGLIAAQLRPFPGLAIYGPLTPLQSRRREVAELVFGPFARAHAEATGRPVRLAHLIEVEA